MANPLDIVVQLASADKIKDVLPKGPEGLKKIRDIDEAVASGAQQAQAALGQMMQQASQALGSLQSVMSTLQSVMGSSGRSQATPTIPSNSLAASHEQAADATDQSLIDLQTYLNLLQTIENQIATIEAASAPISAFNNHEYFLVRMRCINDAIDTLSRQDMSILPQTDLINLLLALKKVMEILATVPVVYLVDFNLSEMVYGCDRIVEDLNFQGMDLSVVNPPATVLIEAWRTADIDVLGESYTTELSHAADRLEAKLNQDWSLSPTEQCTHDAVETFYPEFHALIVRTVPPSYEELTSLLQRMMDAIAACSLTKALGSPMGSSSNIPEIGSLIDAAMSAIRKGNNDSEKIQKAIQKFTQKQNILEKKRQIAKGEMTNPGKGAEATPVAEGMDPAAATASIPNDIASDPAASAQAGTGEHGVGISQPGESVGFF